MRKFKLKNGIIVRGLREHKYDMGGDFPNAFTVLEIPENVKEYHDFSGTTPLKVGDILNFIVGNDTHPKFHVDPGFWGSDFMVVEELKQDNSGDTNE